MGPTSIPHLVPPRALHLSCWSSFKKKRSRSCHIIQIGKLWIFSFWLSKRTGISTRSDSASEGVTQVRLWETDCTTPSEQEWDLATCSISRNFKDVCNICKGAKTAIAQSASLLDLLWNLHPFKSTFQEKTPQRARTLNKGSETYSMMIGWYWINLSLWTPTRSHLSSEVARAELLSLWSRLSLPELNRCFWIFHGKSNQSLQYTMALVRGSNIRTELQEIVLIKKCTTKLQNKRHEMQRKH